MGANSYLFFIISFFLIPSSYLQLAAQTDSLASRNDTIRLVVFTGNRITKEKIIRMYLAIDTGMVFDSTIVANARRRLMESGLFSSVTITPFYTSNGVNLSVYVREHFYLTSDMLTLDFLSSRYEMPYNWWRLRVGITHLNFRGLMERLTSYLYLWEDRALSISWHKPYLPSSFFSTISALYRESPYRSLPRRRTDINAVVSLGRRCRSRGSFYTSIIPSYSITKYKGKTSPDSIRIWDTIFTDNSEKKNLFSYFCTSRVSIDTILITNNRGWRADQRQHHFPELFLAWGTIIDKRNSAYDPRKGWYSLIDFRTNHISPTDSGKFVQLSGDFRFYHNGFFSNDRFCYWFRTKIRSSNGGELNALFAGGEGSARGYPLDYIGRHFIANNLALFSWEYRFDIYTSEAIELPILSDINYNFKEFYFRLDGTLLFDAVHLWHTLIDPFLIWRNESGCSFGSGLRIMFPNIRKTLCFDIACGHYPKIKTPVFFNLSDWRLFFHAYIDMYY